jgi:hypothetical protein
MSPYAVVYVGPPSYRCSKRLNARSYNVQLNGTGDEENIESALVSKAFLGKRVFQILPLPKFGTTSGDKRRKDEVDPYFGPPLSIIPLDRNGEPEFFTLTQQRRLRKTPVSDWYRWSSRLCCGHRRVQERGLYVMIHGSQNVLSQKSAYIFTGTLLGDSKLK